MLILKRLTIWLFKTCFGAGLLGLALIGLFGYDQHAFARSLGLLVSGIILFSFTTGYLLTTVIARAAWSGQRLWSYSLIATILFLVHSQYLFIVAGGLTRSERLSTQIAGCCVVFVCTFLGSVLLQKWVSNRSKLLYAPNRG